MANYGNRDGWNAGIGSSGQESGWDSGGFPSIPISNETNEFSTDFVPNGRVDVPDNVSLNMGAGDFSAFMRMNADTVGVGNVLLTKQLVFLGFRFGYQFFMFFGLLIFQCYDGGGGNTVQVTGVAPSGGNYVGKWASIGYRRSGSVFSIIYNGALNATTVDNLIGNINSNVVLKIGVNRLNGQGWDGKIDEIGLWKGVALSDADFNKLHNDFYATVDYLNPNSYYSDGASKVAALTAWWKMGDGDVAPTVTDFSTNTNNGTIVGTASFVQNVSPNP